MMGSPTLYPYHMWHHFPRCECHLVAYWCLLVFIKVLGFVCSCVVFVVVIWLVGWLWWSRCSAVEVMVLWIVLRATLDKCCTTKYINSCLWILTLGRMWSGIVLVWETCQVWWMLGLRVCDTCVCVSCFSWTCQRNPSQRIMDQPSQGSF